MLLGLWDYYNLLAQCIPLSLHAGKVFDKVEWSVFNQVNIFKVFQGYRSEKLVVKRSGLDKFSKEIYFQRECKIFQKFTAIWRAVFHSISHIQRCPTKQSQQK